MSQQQKTPREIQVLNDLGNIREILRIVKDDIAELFNDTETENIYQVKKLTWISNSQILNLKKVKLSIWSIHTDSNQYMTVKISRSLKK